MLAVFTGFRVSFYFGVLNKLMIMNIDTANVPMSQDPKTGFGTQHNYIRTEELNTYVDNELVAEELVMGELDVVNFTLKKWSKF